MVTYLLHPFKIFNHPVKGLKPEYQLQYATGLSMILWYASNGDVRVKILFEAWISAISQNTIPHWPKRRLSTFRMIIKTKKALSTKLDGFKLINMRQSFIFDCFYILQTVNPAYVERAYEVLRHDICGPVTRFVALNDIHSYFLGKLEGEYLQVSNDLVRLREKEQKFQSKPEKRILIVATMNAGKSTLVNAITGYKINKVKNSSCTTRLRYLYNKPFDDGLIKMYSDGTYQYQSVINLLDDNVSTASFHFNQEISDRICLIDTPGVNSKKNIEYAKSTLKAIKENKYDILIFVSNANYLETDDEAELMRFTIKHCKRPIIYVLNKLDSLSPEDDSISEMVKDYKDFIMRMKGKPIIIPLSAYTTFLLKSKKCLSTTSEMDLRLIVEKFNNQYYNLESYAYLGNLPLPKTPKNLLSLTGYNLLECVIKYMISNEKS